MDLQDGHCEGVCDEPLLLKVENVDDGYDNMTYDCNNDDEPSITIKCEPGTEPSCSSSASVTNVDYTNQFPPGIISIVDYTDHFPPSTVYQQHSDQSAAEMRLPHIKGNHVVCIFYISREAWPRSLNFKCH